MFGSDSLAPGEPAQRWLSEWTIDMFVSAKVRRRIPAKAPRSVIPAKAGIHRALEDQNGSRLSPG
jgi:hypothetical protein